MRLMILFSDNGPFQHTQFTAIQEDVNTCTDSQYGALMDPQAMTIQKYYAKSTSKHLMGHFEGERCLHPARA